MVSTLKKHICRRKVKQVHAMFCQEALDTRKNYKELHGIRDVFDRFLYLSTVKELDLKRVLAYPLTSAPLSFAHIDGLEISTDKSTFSVSWRLG